MPRLFARCPPYAPDNNRNHAHEGEARRPHPTARARCSGRQSEPATAAAANPGTLEASSTCGAGTIALLLVDAVHPDRLPIWEHGHLVYVISLRT